MDNNTRTLPQSVEVLIVGGGPIGILSAIAFARYGRESVVLERHATRLGQPKAHVISPRSVEIFRQYGLDVASLREQGLPCEDARNVRFGSSMTGLEYGVIDTGVDAAPALAASPEIMFNVAQPLLEELLLEAALKTGKVTYLRQHEWKGCSEDPVTKEIKSTVLLPDSNPDAGDDATRVITSKYLIACDGTNARSRDILRIPFKTLDGAPERVLHYVSVHFSADLSHLSPGMLWFILNPTGTGVFIAYNRKNSWVFTIQYDPAMIPSETFTSEFLKAQAFKAAGGIIEDYKELGITLWKTSPKIAESYRCKTIPRAFLAGDAAHSFPPTGGLGMNTGIGDVHNLAWKIDAVEKGWTTPAFLDTVTSERWAVANDNSKQSKINEENIFRLVSAIFKPGMSPEQLWADEASRREIQDAIQYQRDHFDSLNLQIGYVYGSTTRRGVSDYRKECIPGARLPHEWVTTATGKRVSTLDLVDGRNGFVLFTSPDFTKETNLVVDGVPVTVVQLGRDFSDPSGEWMEIMGLTTTGSGSGSGVLVRPDQHIVGSVASVGGVSGLLSELWGGKSK